MNALTMSESPLQTSTADSLGQDSIIQIDSEFADLVPSPTQEERHQLEENLLSNGCRDPLVVWKGHNVLLDGRLRVELCRKNGIPTTTTEIELPNREAARQWIIRNQLGRRNLSPNAASYLRGKLYDSIKKQGTRTDRTTGEDAQRLTTAEKLGAVNGVNESTIRRDAKFAKAVDMVAATGGDEVKRKILSGESRVSRKEIDHLSTMRPETLQEEIVRLGLVPGDDPSARPSADSEETDDGADATSAGKQKQPEPRIYSFKTLVDQIRRAEGIIKKCQQAFEKIATKETPTPKQKKLIDDKLNAIVGTSEQLRRLLASRTTDKVPSVAKPTSKRKSASQPKR